MTYYVYFVQIDRKGNQPVKIGYSKDPEARLKGLQTANPDKLKICLSLPFESEDLARELERTMHYLASRKHKRLCGEWFFIYGSWKKFISESMKLFDGNQITKQLHADGIL